jgi:hypothetical protein
MSRRPSKRVCVAPMAVASDGNVLINVAMTDGPTDPKKLVERALAQGTAVFVGVVATAQEIAVTKRWMDDATAEVIGTIWSGRGRRRHGG